MTVAHTKIALASALVGVLASAARNARVSARGLYLRASTY
jgi:hypothetical protein